MSYDPYVVHVPSGFDHPKGTDKVIYPQWVCCVQCGAAVANHTQMTERHLTWHEKMAK